MMLPCIPSVTSIIQPSRCLSKMMQICLVFVGILIVASARSASSTYTGTCASIGYSTRCCPPWGGDTCLAADGDCYCSADCHIIGDCCEDVHCPSQRRTCGDVGITQCCDDPSGSGLCNVHDQHTNYRCSCNVSCHARNDCCPDALTFCIPETCADARKYPECCNRVTASACYVPGGNCYCDPLCPLYNDCCNDTTTLLKSECSSSSSSRFSKLRLQSFQIDEGLSRRRFYNRERRIQRPRANINYVYQEAPASRVQQEFREFRRP